MVTIKSFLAGSESSKAKGFGAWLLHFAKPFEDKKTNWLYGLSEMTLSYIYRF